jgi:hypothetical protein
MLWLRLPVNTIGLGRPMSPACMPHFSCPRLLLRLLNPATAREMWLRGRPVLHYIRS